MGGCATVLVVRGRRVGGRSSGVRWWAGVSRGKIFFYGMAMAKNEREKTEKMWRKTKQNKKM